MDVKKDIKYVVRDFIGVNGGKTRLSNGQTFGEFIRNKKYGTNKEQDRTDDKECENT